MQLDLTRVCGLWELMVMRQYYYCVFEGFDHHQLSVFPGLYIVFYCTEVCVCVGAAECIQHQSIVCRFIQAQKTSMACEKVCELSCAAPLWMVFCVNLYVVCVFMAKYCVQ